MISVNADFYHEAGTSDMPTDITVLLLVRFHETP